MVKMLQKQNKTNQTKPMQLQVEKTSCSCLKPLHWLAANHRGDFMILVVAVKDFEGLGSECINDPPAALTSCQTPLRSSDSVP